MDGALGPVCAIILVTGAGGMFGGVLRASGIGQALAGSLESLGMPLIVAAFLISTALRVAQGSATVALTTTAGPAGADRGGDDRAQRLRPLLPRHRHRLRRDGAHPRQRLRASGWSGGSCRWTRRPR